VPGPGKYILDEIHKEIDKAAATNGGDRIRFRWIPGHQGVKGNEEADMEAKKAAEGETSLGGDLPRILQKNLPTNKAAEKQRFNKEVKEVRAERWKWHTEGKFISKTAPELPSKKHCAKLGELSRKGASIWTQLKTGHVGLNTSVKHASRLLPLWLRKQPLRSLQLRAQQLWAALAHRGIGPRRSSCFLSSVLS
jgi:hypothetical protein